MKVAKFNAIGLDKGAAMSSQRVNPPAPARQDHSKHVHCHETTIDKVARAASKAQTPVTIWFTGLSGAGKSTTANLVETLLHEKGRHTYLLDGDNLRLGLNGDLGFSATDRAENVRRVAEVAKLMLDGGLIVLVCLVSPFRAERRMARTSMGDGEFIEVLIDTSLEECARRDPKGLYKRALAGEIQNFTGVSSPYEAPESPEIHVLTETSAPLEIANAIIDYLESRDACGAVPDQTESSGR
jgi:bifunctional enzyme CysN/CysC